MIDGETWGRLAYLILLLAVVGGWVVVEYRKRMGAALRTFLAWGLIFVAMMVGYGLWTDMRTQISGVQSVTAAGQVAIPQSADGHYHPVLTVNGTRMSFVADTGASMIVLSQDAARRLGIDTSTLVFLGSAQTANGVVRTARVILDEVSLGPFTDRNVAAYVTDGQMDGALLGMDYLGRFRIEIAGEQMVLSR